MKIIRSLYHFLTLQSEGINKENMVSTHQICSQWNFCFGFLTYITSHSDEMNVIDDTFVLDKSIPDDFQIDIFRTSVQFSEKFDLVF